MSISLLDNDYNTFKEIPYLNGGKDVSSVYSSDINELRDHISNSNKYLNSHNIQTALKANYNHLKDHEVGELDDYIKKAFIENEKLSKEELKNKLNVAIKTKNIHNNIENNKLYNAAIQKMVEEDIDLDTIDIEKMKQILHNKTRNLEISQYYDEKMNAQIGIVKPVIIMLLVLLTITMLYKMNILNTNLYIALIGFGLACIVIFTIGRLIDIIMRDNNKFDEYTYVRSHYYLNKGDDKYKTVDDIPLHQQSDLISDRCLQVMNDISNN